MFQSAGLFKDVSCPYFLYGLCERPHCHFKHSKQEEAKARKEADEGKKETESDEGYALPTSSLQRTLQAIEDNIKSEKKKLSTKDEPGEENKVTKSDKKALKNKPTGTPEYNPTPIQELKKKKIQGKLGRSKYDLALLQKPETDSEYDPECNFSTNGNTGHSGEGTVPDYAKSLHGLKRTVDENDEDGSPLAKIPKFVSVDYMPSVIETEVSDDEPIGEKEDWFSENENRNSNDSGNIESSEEKPNDNGDADETPSEKNSLPIEFTSEGFVKYVPTKIDNKKKDSKGDAKDGKPSLNDIVFPNDSKEKDTNKESDSTHTKKRDPCSYNIFSLFKNEFDKVFEDSESSTDNDKTMDKSHRKSSESEHKINEKKPRGCHSEKHTNNHKHQSKDKGDSHSLGSKDRSSSKEKSVTSNHGSSSSKHSSSSSKHSSSTSKSSSSSSKESGSLSKHSSSKHSSSSSKHSSSSSRERSSSSKHSSSKHSSSSSKDTRPSPSSSTSKHDKHKNSKLERSDGSKSSSGKNHRESHSTDRDSKKLSKPSKKTIVNLDVDLFGEDILNMSNNHNDDDDTSDLEKYFEEDPFEECLRIFNEDKNNGSTKTDKKSAGLFKDVSCPYFLYGLCERPHCHFKHSKQEEAKARKEADAGKKETESDEGYALPTSSLQRTLQAIEDNIKSEKKKLSTKDEPGEENKVTKSDKKVLKNKPTGTPEYNPTPIQELKKKKIQGKLGRSKYDLALLQKPETDSEYDPECNFSTNGNTGHSGEGTVPDYAKSLHGVKRTVDENDEDGSPLAKIPKFVSVDYMPSVIETEVSDDELIGEKEDWFSENESRNSNDSGNIESSEEKPKDNGDADETPSEKNSLPIEFTSEGFVKYVPTKIDNKKKDSKGDAKDGKPSLNGIVFPNDSKEKDTNKESDSTHTKKRDPCSYNIFSLFKNEFDKVFEDSESSKDNDKTRDKSHRKSSESEHKINEKKPRGCHSEKHTNNHKHQSKDKGDSHSSGSKDRSSSKEKNVTSNHGSSSSKHSSSSSKHSSSTSKSSSSSSKESGSLSKHSSSKHRSSSSKHSSSSSRERSSSSKLSSSKHSSSSSKDTRPSPSSSTSKHDKHKNSKLERSDGSKSSSGKNHRESHSTDRDSKKLSKPSKKSIVNLDVDLFGEDVLNMSNNHNDDDDMSDLEKYFEEDPFEECLRIFNEDKNNGSTKTDKKKMKKSSTVEDAPPPVVVGKKRIALKENEDKAKRQKVDDKPKPKPSPAQVMMNRYKMMQERALLAEQERKEKVKAKVKEMQAGRMANPPPPVAGPNIAGSISTFTTYMNNKNKKTAAITVAKGAKRKAHTPTVEIEKLKRPAVQMTSSTKVPANVRQRYLNLFIDECLKLCRTEREAYDKGKAEEEAAFNRCSNKKIDLNIVVHTIKRLRTEIEEKKARKNAPKKEAKLSHAAMLGGAHAKNTSFTLNRSGGAVKLREEDFKGAELYNCLKSYILTEEQLNMNNFPRPDPAKGGCAVYLGEVNNAQKGSVKGYEKICIRCGKRFEVYPNGKYPKKEECVYHWGKAWKKKVAGTIDTRYTCCSGDLSAEGCQVARAHVHETNKKENLSGFMKTIPYSPPIDGDYGVYAMDCEMVYTTMGMELARVTVVDGDGEVAYESLVQPDNPVVDCNTRFSGITDEDLEDVSTSLRDVQAVLLCLFTDKAILLGHRLESDLTAVKLIHSTVVDTSIVFPHRMGLPYKRALINLMIEYLKKIIQDDVAGYDSHEDALACLQLMQYKLKEDDRKEASDKEKVTSEMKYDMGWQKRGSKRSYDSRSGVGTLISNTTGKVCAYGIRSKDCRVCTLHHNKGTPVSTHKCYKNWKGMEPDVGNETLTKESREGITYQPGVANSHIGEIIAIPGPGLIPEPKPIEQFLPTEKFVFCDIETTSLSANADIVQIAAVCENDTFNQYICPQQQISYQASEVTGLKVIGGNLFYKGNIVETVALMEALKSFLNFLEKKGLCILIGHNFKRFDFPRLLRSFELCSLIDSLQNKTKGIVDTLPLFKEVYPGLRRYGQEFIVSTIMQDSYDSHNALADVESLQKLFTASNIPQDIILKFSIGIKSAIEQNEYKKTCETNLETLQILINEQVLSKSMAEKVAKSGLQFSHLKVAVNHSGLGGLTNVLGEKIKGKPRVTCRKSILKSLFNYFKTNEQ